MHGMIARKSLPLWNGQTETDPGERSSRGGESCFFVWQW